MIQVKDKSFTVSKNKNRKSINITWPTLRKSQLKTLEDTAINSLSKLSYLSLALPPFLISIFVSKNSLLLPFCMISKE